MRNWRLRGQHRLRLTLAARIGTKLPLLSSAGFRELITLFGAAMREDRATLFVGMPVGASPEHVLAAQSGDVVSVSRAVLESLLSSHRKAA